MTDCFTLLAFDNVGLEVFAVARITLALLILALLASAARTVVSVISQENDIVYEAMLGLDRAGGEAFYRLYRSREPKSAAFAWLCSVVAGPIGAFGYLRDWRIFSLALVTLNGLGGWWIESWFSVPQLVLIRNRRIARWAVDQVPYVLQGDGYAER
jgi:hypothetical protein